MGSSPSAADGRSVPGNWRRSHRICANAGRRGVTMPHGSGRSCARSASLAAIRVSRSTSPRGAGRDIAIGGKHTGAAVPRLPLIRPVPLGRCAGSCYGRATHSLTRNEPIWRGSTRCARRLRVSRAASWHSPPYCGDTTWRGSTPGYGAQRRAALRRCRQSHGGCGATAMPWKQRWRRSGATDRRRAR